MGRLPCVEVLAESPVYVTNPRELEDQPWFANQVASLRCRGLEPLELLRGLRSIEDAMGRVRVERFGPRVIDLDLLLFGQTTMQTEELVLPHPRMRGRAFVLAPLRDVAEQLVFPDGQALVEALGKIAFRIEGNRLEQY